MTNRFLFLFVLVIVTSISYSQDFKFAFLSDTHIGVRNADEDLRRSVADINADTTLKFVIISGDITDLGNDEEMWTAKNILSKLNKPLYVVTGNHDANWSPNGGRIFNKLFGFGRFSFQYNGYLFIGTNAGPVMQHHGPGQVPKEDLVWMDSILNNLKDRNMPVVYVNHFPQRSSQRNYYEAMDILEKNNLQLILVGHGHSNNKYDFDGVPGIMGRTNMRVNDSIGAFNVVTFKGKKVTFEERRPIIQTQIKWAEAKLFDHHFSTDTTHYPRPSYDINTLYPNVKMLWQHRENFDIGGGIAIKNNVIICTSNEGSIYGLNASDGSKKWSYLTKGKIYSTPAVIQNYVVIASTDSIIYCLHASDGKLVWKYKAAKPFVATPVISDGAVFIGGSDGHFRAITLKEGKLKWDFEGVEDFVMTKPLVYDGKIFFGSWGNKFYALNVSDGKLAWKWTDTSGNRMFSPANCWPVATKGRVFIVAPDEYMTALQAKTGNVIWRTKMDSIPVRGSMGLSKDSSLVFVKTTDGELYGISTSSNKMVPSLSVKLHLGTDMSDAPITENKDVIYVPSNWGLVSSVDGTTGKLLWQYKISNCNVTSVMPFNNNKVIVSTVDGKVSCLQF